MLWYWKWRLKQKLEQLMSSLHNGGCHVYCRGYKNILIALLAQTNSLLSPVLDPYIARSPLTAGEGWGWDLPAERGRPKPCCQCHTGSYIIMLCCCCDTLVLGQNLHGRSHFYDIAFAQIPEHQPDITGIMTSLPMQYLGLPLSPGKTPYSGWGLFYWESLANLLNLDCFFCACPNSLWML